MKRVLITGASRGIGYSTAAIFLKHGYHVIGTSRKAPLQDELFPDADCFRMVSLDLNSTASIEALYEKTGDVDIVIHNAGISQIGAAEETAVEDAQKLFALNFFGPVQLNRIYLPAMRKQGFGKILHISSLAAKIPVPFSGMYAASKAALDAYSAALRSETAPFGIQVSSIYFDYVATTLPQVGVTGKQSPYSERAARYKSHRDRFLQSGMPPQKIGNAIYHAVAARHTPQSIAVGSSTIVRSLMVRLLPRRIIEAGIRKTFE
jgi:short-subunit dehydrogenase